MWQSQGHLPPRVRRGKRKQALDKYMLQEDSCKKLSNSFPILTSSCVTGNRKVSEATALLQDTLVPRESEKKAAKQQAFENAKMIIR